MISGHPSDLACKDRATDTAPEAESGLHLVSGSPSPRDGNRLASAGLAVVLLPLWIIAIPGVILMLVLPAVLLLIAVAVPALVVGAVLAPPFLVVRAVRRRRSAREQARVDHERGDH